MHEKPSGQTAYDMLLDAIRAGTYLPGTRLREEEVGAALALSRTPVREALRRLEADGIVEHRPRIGAVVRKLSYGEIVELYEMRMVLERSAAQMAAKHGSPAELDAMVDLNSQIAAARDTPQVGAQLNQRFHKSLYLSGRNRFLLESARALNNALLLLGPTTYDDPTRIDVVVGEHATLLDALRAGDAEAAGAAAEAHLQTSLRHRLKGLDA